MEIGQPVNEIGSAIFLAHHIHPCAISLLDRSGEKKQDPVLPENMDVRFYKKYLTESIFLTFGLCCFIKTRQLYLRRHHLDLTATQCMFMAWEKT